MTAEHALEFSEQAYTVLTNCRSRLWAVEEQYGKYSEEHVDMLESLLDNLINMIRLGGRVSKDDELAFLLQSFITVGIIFHSKRDPNNPLLGSWSSHS